MKHFTHFKSSILRGLLSLFFLTAMVSSAWGTEVTFDMNATNVTNENFTIAATKGEGANSPAYTNNELRIYASNIITISTSGSETITDVSFVYHKQGSKEYITSVTADCGTYTSGGSSSNSSTDVTDTWKGSTKELTLTMGKSGQRVFVKATVTYTTPSSEQYTVTFDAGSGTCSTSSSKEESPNEGITLPSCTAADGYKFIGWSTEKEPTGANAGTASQKYHPSENVTLYAFYKKYYTITITTPENGTLVVTNNDTSVSTNSKFISGDVLSIEATPAEGYKFRNIQVKEATTHTYTANSTTNWTMTESNVTISATFTAIPTYSVTWNVNGLEQTDSYKEGDFVKFPPKPDDIYGKKFVGWSENPIVGSTEEKPDVVDLQQWANKNVTYYAVFATKTKSGEITWNKVTDANDLQENDVIAIVSSEAVNYNIKGDATKHDGFIALGKTQNQNNRAGVVVTVENDILSINDNVQQITLTKGSFDDNDGANQTDWQLGVDNGYLYVCSSSSNYLRTQEKNNINGLWNISISDGKATIYAKYSSNTRKYIRVNGNYQNSTTTTASPLVTAYNKDATTGVPASIYKKNEDIIYSNYCTTIPPRAFQATIAECGYTTVCLPYNAIVEEGASAYALSEITAQGLVFSPVNAIKANEGYLIKGTVSQTYNLTESQESNDATNILKGVTDRVEVSTLGIQGLGAYAYPWILAKDGTFKKYTGGFIPANKAYLDGSYVATYVASLPSNSSELRVIFSDDINGNETAIPEIDPTGEIPLIIYTMTGIRIPKVVEDGLYIVNGKTKWMLAE